MCKSSTRLGEHRRIDPKEAGVSQGQLAREIQIVLRKYSDVIEQTFFPRETNAA